MSLQASQGFQICFEVGEEGGADPRFLNPYGEQVIAHTCGIIAWPVRKCPPHHHRRLAELRPALRRAPGDRPFPPLGLPVLRNYGRKVFLPFWCVDRKQIRLTVRVFREAGGGCMLNNSDKDVDRKPKLSSAVALCTPVSSLASNCRALLLFPPFHTLYDLP